MHVDLPVLDSVEEVLHAELVSKTATVLLKATRHISLFFGGQELGCAGVVLHVEECNNGDNEGDDAFEYEDPLQIVMNKSP